MRIYVDGFEPRIDARLYVDPAYEGMRGLLSTLYRAEYARVRAEYERTRILWQLTTWARTFAY